MCLGSLEGPFVAQVTLAAFAHRLGFSLLLAALLG